jgi:flagellar hook-associated protein 1
MSIGLALSNAMSGLRTTQTALSITASNVSNAQTPGYVRKSVSYQATAAGDVGGGVRVVAINRELDLYLQRQLRVELSGAGYAETRASFYQRLQSIYGQPGSSSSLETLFNDFTNAIQSLITSPESPSARSVVLSAAQVLAQTLNGMSADIQSLRSDAEGGISDAVGMANIAMEKIAAINGQLLDATARNAGEAALLDQRDYYITVLSELMDIRVIPGDNNQLNVFTTSGIQLVGAEPSRLVFTPTGTMMASTQWDLDQSLNTAGSLMLVSPSGSSIDLIATKGIRSGEIAAYLEMRDQVLVQAQNQLDAMAAAMASALSDTTVAGEPVASGSQAGFEVDAAGMLAGNSFSLTYFDRMTNQEYRYTIVRVDDPAALPLNDKFTVDPNDKVVGIDFSGGMASVVSQLNTLFDGRLEFANPSGDTLRVLDDGVPNRTDVHAFSITKTATQLSGDGVALPLFTDGGGYYTGAVNSSGHQSVGFAGRISVNLALIADPGKLVAFDGNAMSGDPARPNFIYEQLTQASFGYPANTGIGSTATPFNGSLPAFLRQVLSSQGEAAATAEGLAAGQRVVVNAIMQRFNDSAGVDIDQEMAMLIAIQTAYGANARVMAVIREMLDALMRV